MRFALPLVLFVVLFVSYASLAGKNSPESSVTIPTKEYLDFKERLEVPAVKSVEEVTLKGAYGKNLQIEFSGASSDRHDRKEISQYNGNFSLFNCKGDAVLDRDGEKLTLTPLSARFHLTCQVGVTNWSSLGFELHNVLFFRADVTGAQTIVSSDETGNRKITITKESKDRRTPASLASAIAKYQLTAMPDETRFVYSLEISNPGRSIKDYELSWQNGEVIQEIRTSDTYRETDEGIELQLKPGTNNVLITGKFPAAEFTPLVDSEAQYLLIESHPMLQMDIATAAHRIAVGQSQMQPHYANAKAYLFSGATSFSWTQKKLEVVDTLGFSTQNASYNYYIPEAGSPIVEAYFKINNQGTPEIPLAVPGKPTYLEIDEQAEPLYTDAKENLLLRLSGGIHTVLVQYRAEIKNNGLFALVSTPLIRPNSVLSNVELSFSTPEKWRLLYGQGLFHSQSAFHVGDLVAALVGMGLLFWFCTTLAVTPKRKIALTVAAGVMLLFSPSGLILEGLVMALMALYHFRKIILNTLTPRPVLSVALGLVILMGCVPAVIFVSMLGGGNSDRSRSYVQAPAREYKKINDVLSGKGGASKAELSGDAEIDDGESGSLAAVPVIPAPTGGGQEITSAAYSGTPARIQVPMAQRTIAFNQELIDHDGEVQASALFISEGLISALFGICALAFAGIVLVERKWILLWLRNEN